MLFRSLCEITGEGLVCTDKWTKRSIIKYPIVHLPSLFGTDLLTYFLGIYDNHDNRMKKLGLKERKYSLCARQ